MSRQLEEGGKVVSAEFLRGSPSIDALGRGQGIEVALIGRSNVGKSTLINRLCGRKKLARTSAAPGSTSQIILYQVSLGRSSGSKTPVVLADLPGYGFALRSKKEQRGLGRLIQDYLVAEDRPDVLCLLCDCRREPGPEEFEILDLARSREVSTLLLLTKVDKLSRGGRASRVPMLAAQFGLEASDVICTGEGESLHDVWRRVLFLADALKKSDD
jgi:GTP-binding protein